MKFSQRIGKTLVRELIQIDYIDHRLENKLWNNIIIDFLNKLSDYESPRHVSQKIEICTEIWIDFFGERIDKIPTTNGLSAVSTSGIIFHIEKWFFSKSQWFEKYDLIEYLCNLNEKEIGLEFNEKCNSSLIDEMAGYRIINNLIVQINNKGEIEEIEKALENSSPWKSVNTHLETAVSYLSNRNNPDFRNSIKESISAIESLCAIITKDEKASLSKALNIIETEHAMHPALKKAFTALYGYTSDSGGIRHNLSEEDIEVNLEEAKFMLITCSAFINYLIAKTI